MASTMEVARPRRTVDGVADLFPGYFALVMATGIVSLAAFLLGKAWVAWPLLAFNVVAFGVLWILTAMRFARHRARFLADVVDHGRGPGFFTMVAGTCVLGTQFVVLTGSRGVALGLWWVGIVLWSIITYTFFAAVTVRERKPALESGINGAWLIAIVATQSVSVLGTLVAAASARPSTVLLFVALCFFLLGCIQYLIVITLIVYRFTFFRLTTAALTPPYWINMGAVAITTLAGSVLILAAPEWRFLRDLLPFLKGFTLFFWSAATWWIPLLLILGVWRHVFKRFPLEYDPQYWGMVFPLGMYTAGTIRLSQALDVPFLMHIPRYFVHVALLAWAAVFLGLVLELVGRLRRAPAPGLALGITRSRGME